jgi:hypothetical protein
MRRSSADNPLFSNDKTFRQQSKNFLQGGANFAVFGVFYGW